jgi:hypothetical protein
MRRKIITESQLHRVICETVKKVLRERVEYDEDWLEDEARNLCDYVKREGSRNHDNMAFWQDARKRCERDFGIKADLYGVKDGGYDERTYYKGGKTIGKVPPAVKLLDQANSVIWNNIFRLEGKTFEGDDEEDDDF